MKRALYEAPENVATLIKVVTSRLFNLVSDHTFPTHPNASVASFATSFIKSSTGSQERNTNKEVLNCIRVLQRVLPVVFEIEADASKFEREILWKKEVVEGHHEVDETTRNPQFVIEDDEDEDETGATGNSSQTQPSGSSSSTRTTKTLPSVAEKLFTCLVDLLFCCGFTLPTKIQVDHYKINYTIW